MLGKPTKGKRPKGSAMRDVYGIGAYTTVFKKHPGMGFLGVDVLVGYSQTIKRVGSADRHSRAALSSARRTLATGRLDAGPMTALPAGLKQACREQTYVSTSTAAATGVIENKTLGENGE
jgi:hypothetical protein